MMCIKLFIIIISSSSSSSSIIIITVIIIIVIVVVIVIIVIIIIIAVSVCIRWDKFYRKYIFHSVLGLLILSEDVLCVRCILKFVGTSFEIVRL